VADHTPGPLVGWRMWWKSDDDTLLIQVPDGREVAIDPDKLDLIAAAPDLLAALEGLLDEATCLPEDEQPAAWMKAAREAIAKAEVK